MSIFRAISDLFFPPKCIFCGHVLAREERGERICRGCRRTLPYNEELIPPSGELGRVCAPLLYRDDVREALRRFKFRGRTDYARPLGELLAAEIERRFAGGYDLIVYAPISRRRLGERGYDQSMLLAQSAALALGSVAVSALEKYRDTPPNSSLEGAGAREKNVRDVYRVSDAELVAGRRVLLIDDIYTTGATMRACAAELSAAGAECVLGATVARTEPK